MDGLEFGPASLLDLIHDHLEVDVINAVRFIYFRAAYCELFEVQNFICLLFILQQ